MFFIYFKAANMSFESGSIDVDDVEGELRTWSHWHWARVLLGMIAFSSSLLALVYTL